MYANEAQQCNAMQIQHPTQNPWSSFQISQTQNNHLSIFDKVDAASNLLSTISPPPPEEIHHLPRCPTTPRMIAMRRSIPIPSLLLIRLGKVAIILHQHTSAAGLSSLRALSLRLSSSVIVFVETARVRLSTVLEIHKRGFGFGS
jgi:hypothetical protein